MTKDEVLHAMTDMGCIDVMATYQPAYRDTPRLRYPWIGIRCQLPSGDSFRNNFKWPDTEEQLFAEKGEGMLLELRALIREQDAKALAGVEA